MCSGNERLEDTASLSNTTDNLGAIASSQIIETNSARISHSQFVDCGPTMKEELIEENMELHDPLSLFDAVECLLDESVTYEESFV